MAKEDRQTRKDIQKTLGKLNSKMCGNGRKDKNGYHKEMKNMSMEKEDTDKKWQKRKQRRY